MIITDVMVLRSLCYFLTWYIFPHHNCHTKVRPEVSKVECIGAQGKSSKHCTTRTYADTKWLRFLAYESRYSLTAYLGTIGG